MSNNTNSLNSKAKPSGCKDDRPKKKKHISYLLDGFVLDQRSEIPEERIQYYMLNNQLLKLQDIYLTTQDVQQSRETKEMMDECERSYEKCKNEQPNFKRQYGHKDCFSQYFPEGTLTMHEIQKEVDAAISSGELSKLYSVDVYMEWIRKNFFETIRFNPTKHIFLKQVEGLKYGTCLLNYSFIVMRDILLKNIVYCNLRIGSENISIKDLHKECYHRLHSDLPESDYSEKEKNHYRNFHKKCRKHYHEQINYFVSTQYKLYEDCPDVFCTPYRYLLYGMIHHAQTSPHNYVKQKFSSNKSIFYYNAINDIILQNPNKVLIIQERYCLNTLSKIPLILYFSEAVSEWTAYNVPIYKLYNNDKIFDGLMRIVMKLIALNINLSEVKIVINMLFCFAKKVTKNNNIDELVFDDFMEIVFSAIDQFRYMRLVFDAYFWTIMYKLFEYDYLKIHKCIAKSKAFCSVDQSEISLKNDSISRIFEKIFVNL